MSDRAVVATQRTPRTAYRQRWQEANRRRQGIKEVKIAPCGTMAAYRRHLRNVLKGEVVDEFCRAVHAADARRVRAKARLRRSRERLAEATALIETLPKGSEALAEARAAAKAARADIAAAREAMAAAVAEMEEIRLAAEAAEKAKAHSAA